MGKSQHPADVFRKKQKKRMIKKNKTVRDIKRAASLKNYTEDEIIDQIQKINAAENKGLADNRLLVRRKKLVKAYGDVQIKKKILVAKEKTAKTVTVGGLAKLLGQEDKMKKKVSLNKIINDKIEITIHEEELEYPPGMPIDPSHQRPPGIAERGQNTRRARTYLKRKQTVPIHGPVPARSIFGAVEIVNSDRLNLMQNVVRKHRRKGREAQFLDPLNPASPFYLARPGRPGIIPGKPIPPPMPPPMPPPQHVLQIGPQMRPNPHPLAAPSSAPIQGMIRPPPMYAPIRGKAHKLEVLLSAGMKAFVPTSLRVKRRAPKAKKQRRKKTLDIAPDVGKATTKLTKTKNVRKRKVGMVTEKSYDAFLTEIENLV